MPTSSWVGLGISLAIFATVELLLRKTLGRYAYKRWAQLGVRRLVKTEQWWTLHHRSRRRHLRCRRRLPDRGHRAGVCPVADLHRTRCFGL